MTASLTPHSPDASIAHTPGPWRLHPWYGPRPGLNTKPGRYAGIYEPVPGCEYGSKSLVLGVGIKGDVDDYWLQISDANARLIAAAPDLLEALRALVTESGGKAIPNSSLTACREQAIAAIAKAEGRS